MNSKSVGIAAALLIATACGSSGAPATVPSTVAPAPTTQDTTTTTTVAATTTVVETTVPRSANVADHPGFQELGAGTYYAEPDPGSSPKVWFTVPDKWLQWVGSFKPDESSVGASNDVYVGLTISTVDTLTKDPCFENQTRVDPGPTVADLAAGLAAQPGIVVVQPPTAVTAFGFEGEHLIVAVPNIEYDPAKGSQGFADCMGGEFHGYLGGAIDLRYFQGPGQVLEFWVLDVAGTRVLIEKTHFPQSTPADIAELEAVIASIEIEA